MAKKIPVFLLSFLMFFILFIAVSFFPTDGTSAYALETDGFTYEVNDDHESVTITRYTGADSGELVIPGTIDGFTVTQIGTNAFREMAFTSIVMPESLTTISDAAFIYCDQLTEINIPKNVQYIGQRAFEGCTSVSSVKVDTDNVLYDSRDNSNAIIDSVNNELIAGFRYTKIPDSVKSIAEYAFSKSRIERVTIPDGVKEIKSYTFYDCPALKSVTIPVSVIKISDHAFEGCINLPELDIPDSVKTIGNHAFYACESLTSLDIPEGVTTIEEYTFNGCKSLTSLVIPDSVKTIGQYAIGNCTSLTTLVLPFELTKIEQGLFYGSKGLKEIVIPDGVTEICSSAFRGCEMLESVLIPDTVESIGSYAFYDCYSLKMLIIPDKVQGILDRTFSGCRSMTILQIPYTVAKVGSDCFVNMDSIKDVYYTGSEGHYLELFSSDSWLSQAEKHYNSRYTPPEKKVISGVLNSGNGYENIWTVTYYDLDDKQAKLEISLNGRDNDSTGFIYLNSEDEASGGTFMPWLDEQYGLAKSDFISIKVSGNEYNDVRPIADMFKDYTKVKTVELKDVDMINSGLFRDCKSLRAVDLDEGISEISDYAFYGTALTEIDFMNITKIGKYAFAKSYLGDITLSHNVETISEGAFSDCERITIYCYENTPAHIYADSESIPYVLLDGKAVTPIRLLAMEILCTEYPDQYAHNGSYTNLIGKNVGDILDDSNYSWFGDSPIENGNNSNIKGVKKRLLYSQQLRNWTITRCYKDQPNGFYAITMEDQRSDAKVFVIKNSDRLPSFQNLIDMKYEEFGDELHFLETDWMKDDLPLYFSQTLGPQFDIASKYLEEYLAEYQSDSDIYLTGHSLGAGLAVSLSCKYDIPAISFDATPMLDAVYYMRPAQMGLHYEGFDKWKYRDYINEHDICAGLWECKYKNYTDCYDFNTTEGTFMELQAHAPETILRLDRGKLYVTENKSHDAGVYKIMNKSMGRQELSYEGGPGTRYGVVIIPGLKDFYVTWLSSGNDIRAFSGNRNIFYCGNGDDYVSAYGSRHHEFIGGRGNDNLSAGAGSDEYYYYKGDGLDTIIDKGGNDDIHLYGFDSNTSFVVDEYNLNYLGLYADGELIMKISKGRIPINESEDKITIMIHKNDGTVYYRIEIRVDENGLKEWSGYQHIRIGCPVAMDVYRKNASGDDELVLSIEDTSDPFTETDYGYFYNIPEYDEDGNETGEFEKQALLFDSENYYVLARATSDGTADMNVEWQDGDVEHASEIKGYTLGDSNSYRFDLSAAPKVVCVDDGAETAMEDQVIPRAEYISLSSYQLALSVGDSEEIKANYGTIPSGKELSLIWKSDDPGVAEVADDGTVTANAPGICVISVTDESGSYKAELTVNVSEKQDAIDISNAEVAAVKDVTYTGKSMTPALVVKDGDKVLEPEVDYTLSYVNNVKVGTAQVTITGTGAYTGTLTKSFKIVPKGTSLSKVKGIKKGLLVKWKKQKTQTTGYVIQLALNKKFTKGKKTVTITKSKTTSKSVKKLKPRKKYYVRIRTYKKIGKTKYYSSWSKAKKGTVLS